VSSASVLRVREAGSQSRRRWGLAMLDDRSTLTSYVIAGCLEKCQVDVTPRCTVCGSLSSRPQLRSLYDEVEVHRFTNSPSTSRLEGSVRVICRHSSRLPFERVSGLCDPVVESQPLTSSLVSSRNSYDVGCFHHVTM